MSEAGSSSPTVSVVVAAWEDGSGLSACLEALFPQRSLALEVLVAGSAEVESALRRGFPWVSWVQAGPREPIPHLWERGIRQSRGEMGRLERALRLLTAPLIPAVFLAKIFRRVIGDGRYLGVFLPSLPILAGYLLFWAAGETCGCLGGEPRMPKARQESRGAS
jgi:hypothetical protein